MPSIDTVDSREIDAPARVLFDLILDYPNLREWFPGYEVDLIGGGEICEGARLSHALGKPISPVTTRFERTLVRIEPGKAIEETYDGGDLVGSGRWTFEEQPSGKTKVSFHCKVRSNSLLMHLGFWLTGAKGHNDVYQKMLQALEARAARDRAS